jgi:diguanylate cyclase (GGDEF)-like protein
MQKVVDAVGDAGWRAQWLHERGVLERKLGRFDAALRFFEQSLAIQRELDDKPAVARELNSIGNLHGRTGRFADALLAHNEALRLSRAADDGAEAALSLRMLGVLYRNLDDEELGSKYLREALEYVEERNRREAIALNGELAMSLIVLGRLDEALRHAQESATLAERSGSPPNKVNAYTRMAEVKLAMGDLDEAQRWTDKAFESYESVAIRDQILLRTTRARVLAARGMNAQALQEAQETLAATRRIGDRILERGVLDLLSEQQLIAGDAQNAFVTRKAHQALDKELAMDMAARRIAVLESNLDRQRSETERELLTRDNEIQSLQINRQRWVGFAMAIGITALVAVAALLYGRFRQSELGNARLTASRDELERLHRALLDSSAELARVAHTDSLTGLPNRRAMTDLLEARLRRARGSGRPVAVVLLDVDRFKSINDEHGHLVGDQVLKEVAQRLRANLPAAAEVGRWGGEEFIAVVDDCTLSSAKDIAERLRRALSDTPLPLGERTIPVTASFGVASLPAPSADAIDPLVGAADHALYRAKHAGRNRVETAA